MQGYAADYYGGAGYGGHGAPVGGAYGHGAPVGGAYRHGDHEEHDREVRQMIVALKAEFEAAVESTLDAADARVAAEQEAGDAASAQAWMAFEDEATRLTGEMADALSAALVSFEATLANAKSAIEAETDRAEAALEAYLQDRLVVWADKMAHEAKRAKAQKDSYYRYNLLRLLQAKDDAVNAAINQARSDFAAAMAAEEAESMETRAAQRAGFAAFSATTRQALADAIAEDRATMADEVAERERTLDEFLAD